MKQLSFIVVGAGDRGLTYTKQMLAMPEKYKIAGVADINPEKRERYQRRYGLTAEQCYSDWRDMLAQPKMADIAIIATSDMDHYEPAMRAIELGYDLLLEKPVAPTERECCEIASAAKKAGVKIIVCHVLRYTPFYKKIKSIIKTPYDGCKTGASPLPCSHNYYFSWRAYLGSRRGDTPASLRPAASSSLA